MNNQTENSKKQLEAAAEQWVSLVFAQIEAKKLKSKLTKNQKGGKNRS
jgi:hypothetical protein